MAADDFDLIPAGPDVPEEEGLATPPEDAELPTVVVDDEAEPTPLGRSWAFDAATESFQRSRRGPLETRGAATLLGWVDKCLRTARGALPIHPPGYGVEDPDLIFGRPISELSEQDLERRFRDALTFHPRIADVTDLRLLTDPKSSAAVARFIIVTDPPTDEAELLAVSTSLEAFA